MTRLSLPPRRKVQRRKRDGFGAAPWWFLGCVEWCVLCYWLVDAFNQAVGAH